MKGITKRKQKYEPSEKYICLLGVNTSGLSPRLCSFCKRQENENFDKKQKCWTFLENEVRVAFINDYFGISLFCHFTIV